jgi:hypothetical protein
VGELDDDTELARMHGYKPLGDLAGYEYIWANTNSLHAMETPEFYESQGWERYRQHRFWPDSWLMRRKVE